LPDLLPLTTAVDLRRIIQAPATRHSDDDPTGGLDGSTFIQFDTSASARSTLTSQWLNPLCCLSSTPVMWVVFLRVT
jgi:hypothetical protein